LRAFTAACLGLAIVLAAVVGCKDKRGGGASSQVAGDRKRTGEAVTMGAPHAETIAAEAVAAETIEVPTPRDAPRLEAICSSANGRDPAFGRRSGADVKECRFYCAMCRGMGASPLTSAALNAFVHINFYAWSGTTVFDAPSLAGLERIAKVIRAMNIPQRVTEVNAAYQDTRLFKVGAGVTRIFLPVMCPIAVINAFVDIDNQVRLMRTDAGTLTSPERILQTKRSACDLIYVFSACGGMLPGTGKIMAATALACAGHEIVTNALACGAYHDACLESAAAGEPVATANEAAGTIDCCWCNKGTESFVGVYGGQRYCEDMKGSHTAVGGYSDCQRVTVAGSVCSLVRRRDGQCYRNPLLIHEYLPEPRFASMLIIPPSTPPWGLCDSWAD
jgi:hypothetical protein